MEKVRRVTRKESRISRDRAVKLISDVQKELRKKKIKFTFKIVGSGAWWTIIKDKKGMYDLEYQILLTKNSDLLNKPTKLKNLFYSTFDKLKAKHEKLENSTSAITLTNKIEKYSFDFVILRVFPKNNEIIRRNNKETKNEFTWNLLEKPNKLYEYFNSLHPKEKQIIIEKMVIPEKINEKKKDKNCRRASYEILLSKINKFKTITRLIDN